MKRSIVGLAVGTNLLLASFAHAQTTAVPIANPYTDTIQLWSEIAAAFGYVELAIATAFTPSQAPATAATPGQQTASLAEAVASFQTPTATSTPATTSDQTATPQNVRSAELTEENSASDPVPAFNPSTFVTQSEFAQQLLALSNALAAKFTPTTTPAVPVYVAADGNGEYPFAAENAINNLSNVTIQNPTISGGSVPASSITGTLTNAIDAAAGEIDSLAGTDLTYTAATTTNATSTNLYASNLSAGTLIASGTTTLSVLDLASLNCSTYGNGGKLTTDANGTVTCAADQGGSGSTVGGADTDIQFNDAGSFDGSNSFTFASSTDLLTVTNASTTNLSASAEGFFGTASTTALIVSGAPSGFLQTNAQGVVSATSTFSVSSLFGTLGISNGGTGTSTEPSYGELLVGTGTGYSLTATSSLGLPTFADLTGEIAAGYLFQGAGNSTSTLTQFNDGLTAFASSTIGSGTEAGGLTINGAATTTGNLLVHGNTSLAAATSTSFAITGLASAVLAVNGSGSVVATTTIGSNLLSVPANLLLAGNDSGQLVATTSISTDLLTGTLATLNGTTLPAGGSVTVSAASSTLLGDSNIFSGADSFSNAASNFGGTWQELAPSSFQSAGTYLTGIGNYATTTTAAISISTSTLAWNGLTLGNTFSVSPNGITVTPTVSGTISNSGLQNSFVTVSTGSGLSGGGSVSLGGSTSLSLNLGNANSWTGLQSFSNATSTLLSAGTLWDTGLSNTSLAVNGQGEIVATSTVGSFQGLTGNVAVAASNKAYYVCTTGNNSDDGLSWQSCKGTIQAAITAAGSNGTVYVGAGTYYLTSALQMEPGVRVSCESGATITQGNGADLTVLVDFFTNTADGAELDHCIVDGNRANNSDNSNDALVDLGTANNVIIIDDIVRNANGAGITSGGAYNTISDNTISNTFAEAIGLGAAANTPMYNYVYNNTVNGPTQHSIYVYQGDYNQIIGNAIYPGIVVGGRASAMVVSISGTAATWVSGPTFSGISAGEILVVDGGQEFPITAINSSTSLTVSNAASLTDVPAAIGAADDINITDGSFNQISHNVVEGGATGGIVISNISGSSESPQGNTVDDNTIIDPGSLGIAVEGGINGSTVVEDTSILDNYVLNPGQDGAAAASVSGMQISGPSGTVSGVSVDSNYLRDGFTQSGGYWLTGEPDPDATAVNIGNNVAIAFANGNAVDGITGTTTIASGQSFSVGGSQFVVQQSNGNIGIGTTNPPARLSVLGPSSITSFTGTTNLGAVIAGSGSTNDYSGIDFTGDGDLSDPLGRIGLLSTGNGSYLYFGTSNDYADGITTTPLILSYAGNATVGGCVAYNGGTSGTCLSDERLKTNINDFTDGLSTIVGLNPVTYQYNGLAGTPDDVASGEVRTGLIAQQVQQVAPDLVATTSAYLNASDTNPTILYEVNYSALTFALINAVKQIASISDEFEQNLIAWLGNAQNGIGTLFAQVGNFQTLNASTTNATAGNFQSVNAQQVCLTESTGQQVCVTGDQLAALLSAANAAGNPESVTSTSDSNSSPDSPASATSTAPNSSPDTSTTDLPTGQAGTPPVIQINGDNPAIIQVGATYNDLGATIIGPQQDLNLGIQTFVNRSPMSPIQIDTSEAATDTIDYVVTDQNDLTSTSTRTVIIQAPSIVPSDAASTTDETATTSAATTTDATTTAQ